MRVLLLLLSFTILQSCSPKLKIPVDHKHSFIAEMIQFLAADRMQGRETGTQGEKLASDYIALQFNDIGLKPAGDKRHGDPSYFQSFQGREYMDAHGDQQDDMPSDPKLIKGRNVVAFIDNGASNTVVFGAHYDHIGFGATRLLQKADRQVHNGADDNASGVAVMIYLAKLLRDNNVKHSNFLFIAFSGKEKGLMGSSYYTENPTRPISEINYMVNLDMVGRLKDQRLIINGMRTSPQWSVLNDTNSSFQLIKSDSTAESSDHISFHQKGIPAIHFSTPMHKDYHKASDDVEKLNFRGCYEIAHYIYRIVDKNKAKKMTFTKVESKVTY